MHNQNTLEATYGLVSVIIPMVALLLDLHCSQSSEHTAPLPTPIDNGDLNAVADACEIKLPLVSQSTLDVLDTILCDFGNPDKAGSLVQGEGESVGSDNEAVSQHIWTRMKKVIRSGEGEHEDEMTPGEQEQRQDRAVKLSLSRERRVALARATIRVAKRLGQTKNGVANGMGLQLTEVTHAFGVNVRHLGKTHIHPPISRCLSVSLP